MIGTLLLQPRWVAAPETSTVPHWMLGSGVWQSGSASDHGASRALARAAAVASRALGRLGSPWKAHWMSPATAQWRCNTGIGNLSCTALPAIFSRAPGHKDCGGWLGPAAIAKRVHMPTQNCTQLWHARAAECVNFPLRFPPQRQAGKVLADPGDNVLYRSCPITLVGCVF